MDIKTSRICERILDSGIVSKMILESIYTPQYQWLVDLVHEYDLSGLKSQDGYLR